MCAKHYVADNRGNKFFLNNLYTKTTTTTTATTKLNQCPTRYIIGLNIGNVKVKIIIKEKVLK